MGLIPYPEILYRKLPTVMILSQTETHTAEDLFANCLKQKLLMLRSQADRCVSPHEIDR